MAAQKRKHQKPQSANRKKPKVSNKPELKKRSQFTAPNPRIVGLGSDSGKDEDEFPEPPKSQSINRKKPKVSNKPELKKRSQFTAPNNRIVELGSGDDDEEEEVGGEGEGEGEISPTKSPKPRPINSKKPKGLTKVETKRVAELDSEEDEEEEGEEAEGEEEEEEKEEEEEDEGEKGEEEESARALEDSDADNMDIDTTSKTPAKPSNASSKSKESHAEQKRLAIKRKLSKPNAEVISRAKRIWEQLRRTKLAAKERKKLVDEFGALVKGRVSDLVFKHDASRIVQSALKYGDKETRANIAAELKGTYVALAQSSYGKYLVVKILHYGTPAERKMVIEEFYGQVRKLVKHREAALVIEDAYREYATADQKAALLREFYGVEFAIFKDAGDTSSLEQILSKAPEKRAVVMKSLFEQISTVLRKGATILTILHKAMLEYLVNTKPGTTEVTEFIELSKEHVADISFTKDGAQVVARCIALGTSKDRKVMLKTLKPVAVSLARSEHGHLVLLSILESLDDTVLLAKALLPEFQPNLLDLARDKYARAALLRPFSGRHPRILSPPALKLLQEIDALREATSKKDPATRQAEIVTHFSPPFLQCVADHAPALAEDSFGCQFITEVVLSATSGDKASAISAVAAVAVGDPREEGHIAHSAAGARMLKTLVTGGHFCTKERRVKLATPPLSFHTVLYPNLAPHVPAWTASAGSFVIVAFLESDSFPAPLRKALVKQLSSSAPTSSSPSSSLLPAGNKGAEVIKELLKKVKNTKVCGEVE